MIDPRFPDFSNTPVSRLRPAFSYQLADDTARPYVTIVSPFYNAGRVFEETAQSVLRQSFQQWEWLIINDGSTDVESLAILESCRYRDPRIRVIDHPTNKGLSAARNTGFLAARTQYVIQLDCDDLLEPTAAEKWIWFLECHPEYGFVKGYSVGFGAQEYLWQKGFHNGQAFLEENLVDPTCMIRKGVHQAVGGYDPAIRDGLEDWEFWLRCANLGYWGNTVPEYLNWYRRRANHGDRWKNWTKEKMPAFQEILRQKYPRLWNGYFPEVGPRKPVSNERKSNVELPCNGRLGKEKPRLLMIVPWLTMGGADKFNLDLVQQVTQRGWESTIVTTLKGDHSWLPEFSRHTPDIFVLDHFLRLADYPRFLQYLNRSRRPDVVLISNSMLGYLLLPYLRAFCPEATYVDFCHTEEGWKNGGYPQMSVGAREQLDLTLVSSMHLKQWMAGRGGDVGRIEVCYTNIDPERWSPNYQSRAKVREELKIKQDTPVILYAGRLCQQKQPKVFAQVMKQLRERQCEFLALVAGDGEERAWLEKYVSRQRLGRKVRLLGRVPSERVRALMMASDIFFLPSQWEGIAVSIYEAMACGLAVVGADCGGQHELVTKECGTLMPCGHEQTEVQQYSDALAQLLADPGRRAAMGQAARARICQQFRLDSMGERLVALFEKARFLHRSHPRPAVGTESGLASATQAVDYMRLHHVADWSWLEQTEEEIRHLSLGARLYVKLKRVGLGFYCRGRQRGWQWWMDPLKDSLKRSLLKRAVKSF